MRLSLTADGGNFFTLLRASTDAEANVSGTYYATQIGGATFSNGRCAANLYISKRESGNVTLLYSAAGVPCRNGMVVRTVFTAGGIIAFYIDDVQFATLQTDSSIASGVPGVGVSWAPAGNTISEVSLGALDMTAPPQMGIIGFGLTAFSDRLEVQWQGAIDNPNGAGIAYYEYFRNGEWKQRVRQSELVDAAVVADTSYTLAFAACDFHMNCSTATTLTGKTLASGAIETRQIGLRGTGTYWGGLDEQIDMRSGNLNFSLPLLRAQGRGGWSVPFQLNYDSQNWRKDDGGTWKLGHDVGYGFGWKLMAGSLTPFYDGYWFLHHYLFTDASGAEYRLSTNTNGVWTSSETPGVTYDSNTQRLYFNDGSFWQMGCMSSGVEQDAGTMYPTVFQDTNGNQVLVRYDQGVATLSGNTSARILEIEDTRARQIEWNGPFWTYRFSYTWAAEGVKLERITNSIQTGEAYTFSITTPQTLYSPFSGGAVDVTRYLQTVTMSTPGLSYGFEYTNWGGLSKAIYPYSGYLRWTYQNWTYTGNRLQPEVSVRYTNDGAGGGERTYAIGHPIPNTPQQEGNDGSRTLHGASAIEDPSGTGGRTWVFAASGLLQSLQRRSGGTVVAQDDLTWTQQADAVFWHVSSTVSTMDGQVKKQTAQTMDSHGNLLTMKVWDYIAAAGTFGATASRVYTNTFLNNSNYTSRYIYNRLLTSTVTDGTRTVTLANNTYDNAAACPATRITGGGWQPVLMGSPQDQWQESQVREHDAAYGSSFTYRGNLTMSNSPGHTRCMSYNPGGVALWTYDNGVQATSSYTNSPNMAVPTAMTVNTAPQTTFAWNSFLGLTQETGPNGETASTVYDSYARPASSTSPTGALTCYAYTTNTATATVKPAGYQCAATASADRWSRTTLDGFGRTLRPIGFTLGAG